MIFKKKKLILHLKFKVIMLNKVILIGNLGKDPEIKAFDNGNKIAQFSLATNETYKDREGNRQKQTEWHNIVFKASNLVTLAEKSLKKGDALYIEGKIKRREYEKDGIKRSVTEIIADSVRFLPKSAVNSTSEDKDTLSHDELDEDNFIDTDIFNA